MDEFNILEWYTPGEIKLRPYDYQYYRFGEADDLYFPKKIEGCLQWLSEIANG